MSPENIASTHSAGENQKDILYPARLHPPETLNSEASKPEVFTDVPWFPSVWGHVMAARRSSPHKAAVGSPMPSKHET